MKERFGELGLYLVEKAQKEIKNLNQKILFQKVEIKKKYNDELKLDILRTKEYFETYNAQFFNQILTSTLLNMNKKLLDVKHEMVVDLKKEVLILIKEKIEKNYSKYIKFLLNNIKETCSFLDDRLNITIYFNTRDFEYFKSGKNIEKIQKLYHNTVIIKKINKECIGGFKVNVSEGNISYNNIIDEMINKKSSIFHIELSKVLSDVEIEEIKKNFKLFFKDQKMDINLIESYLISYE